MTVDFGGDPILATGAIMAVECKLADGSDPTDLIDQAKARSTIANSVKGSITIAIERAQGATLFRFGSLLAANKPKMEASPCLAQSSSFF